jgi:oligopeptide transport system ATP-binding protein
MSLLRVEGLRKYYSVREGLLNRVRAVIKAVDGVSFEVEEGTTYGIAGESGSGKSTLCMCVARLTEPTAGRLFFDGREYTRARGEELKRLRADVQMVFQNPASSLDPHMVVKDIVLEPVRAQGMGRRGEDEEDVALEALERVGLSRSVLKRYPHELSGGMGQRVAIARALTVRPRMLILDEPTSALDASMQAQVLNLFNQLQREMKITYLLVSHDLSVIGHMCDSIAVMYAGRIVEMGTYDQLFYEPSHPYTAALLASAHFLPDGGREERFVLRGEMPSARNPPPGCTLHPRCPFATEVCGAEYPPLESLGGGHHAACHNRKRVAEALGRELSA